MPVLSQFPRDTASSDDSSTATLSPIYIAGIALISAIVLAVVLWLVIRQLRIRSRRRREDARGAAFLSVRGVVKEEKGAFPQ